MKEFFLRELAFLLAPVMLLTHPKALISRVGQVLVGLVFILVAAKALGALILHPAGWVSWLGVTIGLAFAAILYVLFMGFGE